MKINNTTLIAVALIGFASRGLWLPLLDREPADQVTRSVDLQHYFDEWSHFLVTTEAKERIKTTAQWENAYQLSAKLLVSDSDYIRVTDRDTKIGARIKEALGTKDGPLDHEKLATVLRTIATDIRGNTL